MSSNAAPVFRFCAVSALIASLAIVPASLAAQNDPSVTQDDNAADEAEAAPRPQPLDLSVTVPRDESDQLLEQDCEREADAARIANEIVVCRQLGQASDGSWNKAEWEKRYAERTKGGGTPDTFGIPNHGNSIGFGSVPPPALLIDVEALPQAPAGSDADRIARGLPPLGENSELSPEEIAKRRRALGLDAPPAVSAPE